MHWKVFFCEASKRARGAHSLYCGHSNRSLMYDFLAQSKDNKQEVFECPTNAGNGNFADPVSCRRFYQVKFVTFS